MVLGFGELGSVKFICLEVGKMGEDKYAIHKAARQDRIERC